MNRWWPLAVVRPARQVERDAQRGAAPGDQRELPLEEQLEPLLKAEAGGDRLGEERQDGLLQVGEQRLEDFSSLLLK